MQKVFIGYDPRQPVSYNVLQHSIIIRTEYPVSITPLVLETLPITRKGLTPFTWSRFLVPYLCDFKGLAVFMDADILVQADIKELLDIVSDLRDTNGRIPAVSVAKNKARFEWASVMVFNCEHPDNTVLTPDFIQITDKGLHGIAWTDSIGDIPDEWNHLVGYDELRQVRVQHSVGDKDEVAQSTELSPGMSHAKLIHFTQGVPAWPITADCEYAEHWDLDKQFMNSAQDWEKLMGHSVHSAKLSDGKVVPKYKLNAIQP